ncbi:two-component system OmpR family response regulator [Litoreibacter ponti]|uniref:Two-component system OmpR family response regulator n=1 Tax=Litoreibacter ponti TaxID=1510457 RepID=A0A2T6BCT9_9RHOB|nr:response regulator transcription factor [Litoreibacter ponti]PTX53869.1 two-component system OmpR family response regulator [Litoreibacter ponti]
MRIAVVEDNEAVAKAVSFLLTDEGHAVDEYPDGAEAMGPLLADPPDLIILDINLPGASGLDVLTRLRRSGQDCPVLLLTARADTEDRVDGLDAGADDYLTKPFEMSELAARVRALLRRRHASLTATLVVGPLTFDVSAREVLNGQERLNMTRREVALFEALALAQGRLVSKERLLEHIYGTGADVETSAIEVHVSRLRKRLEGLSISIRTVRGFGYLMEADG